MIEYPESEIYAKTGNSENVSAIYKCERSWLQSKSVVQKQRLPAQNSIRTKDIKKSGAQERQQHHHY